MSRPLTAEESRELIPFKGLQFRSGKFMGHSMTDVAAQHPSYIVWCWENTATGMGIPNGLYYWAHKRKEALKDALLQQQSMNRGAHAIARAKAEVAADSGVYTDFKAGQKPEHPNCRSMAVAPAEPEEPSFLDGAMPATEEGSFLDGLF